MRLYVSLLGFVAVLLIVGTASSVPVRPDLIEKLVAEGRVEEVAEPLSWEPAALLGARAAAVRDTVACLVILVDFDDVPADTLIHNPARYRHLLFSPDNPNSMRNYFLENSYGKMYVKGDVYGWFRAPELHSFYADGWKGMGSYPRNARRMVEDAVDASDAVVDFSLYDNDGPDRIPDSGDDDGYVDFLLVVHAGRGYEWTLDLDDIHSHAGDIRARLLDDVLVRAYATEPEDAPVGTFAHEFGHLLGLPDLYDITLRTFGLGMWSLMSYGSWGGGDGTQPVGLDAWSKMKLGFLEPVVLAENRSSYGLRCVEDAPEALLLWNGGELGPQYFLVENRRAKSYDSYLSHFGEGLLLYHVDERALDNSTEGKHLISVEQADGEFDLERVRDFGFGSDAGDPYPGTALNREFSWSTVPSNYSYEETPTQVSLRDISNADDIMTFEVEVNSPVLLFEKQEVDDSAGDGDQEPDPGEIILLNIRLRNFGIGCSDVIAVLSTSDPYVEVTGPVAGLPAIDPSAVSGFLQFVLEIGEFIPEPHDIYFDLSIEAEFGGDDFHARESFVLGVPIRALAGWPNRLDGTVYSSPTTYDLDGDGSKEILLGCYDSKMYAWRADGTLMPGWPFETGGRISASAAVCDLDIDGSPEIVFGSQDDYVYVLEVDGTLTPGWPVKTGGPVRSSPVLADIDDDGMVEVICGSTDGKIYAWDEGGTGVPGFPVSLDTGPVWMSPAAGDIDGDHVPDIVAGGYGGDLYVLHGDGTPHDGWPMFIGHGAGRGSPAIADLDGDGKMEIMVSGLWSNSIYVVGGGGHIWPGWPKWASNCPSLSAPIPADIDNDGLPEVAVSTSCGTVIAWDGGGDVNDAITADTGSPIQYCEPVFADLNGNGRLEALVGTVTGEAFAFGATGALEGFPAWVPGKFWATPTVSDLDGDGNVELVFASTDGVVQVWRFVGPKAAGRAEWPKFRGDVWNTGQYGFMPKANRPLPDLEVPVDNLVFAPEKPREGEQLAINFLLRNVGHAEAVDFEVGVFCDGTDEASLIHSFSIESLPAKSDTTLTLNYQVPGKRFSRMIHVVADADHSILERFDLNNCASKRFYLSVPDLAAEITDVWGLPAAPGDSVTICAEFSNGGEDIAREFTLAFYDSVISDEMCIASFKIDSLEIGARIERSVRYGVGEFRDDYVRIWCVVDTQEEVLEYYRSNNVTHTDIQSGIRGEVFAVGGLPPPTSVSASRAHIVGYSPWCGCVFAVSSDEPNDLIFEARGQDIDIAWNTVVYSADGDIAAFNLKDSLSFVISTDVSQEESPVVWGDLIAWVSLPASGSSLKLRAGRDTVRTIRTAADGTIGSPDISDRYVVWQERGDGDLDVYAYDIAGGSTAVVSDAPGDQVNPRVWGSVIVWEDRAKGSGDIYMADMLTGERRAVTVAEGDQTRPAVSGDFVVWQDSRNGGWDIYGYAFAEGTEFPVCRQCDKQTLPSIVDSTVVWLDGREDLDVIRGLRFGGIRRVAEVNQFATLSQDGAIRVVLSIREYDDQISYRLYRYPDPRQIPEGDLTHVRVAFELGHDTTYVYPDTLISHARPYYYTLGIVDGYGLETRVGPVFGSGYRSAPEALTVGLPRPNPVKHYVNLSFGLPRKTVYGAGQSWPEPSGEKRGVNVSIYNVQGRLVRTLVDHVMAPGYHEVMWDSRDERGVNVSSGVYFISVSVDGAMTSRKVLILH